MLKQNNPTFRPFLGLSHPALQTIVGAKIKPRRKPPALMQRVGLADGDQLAIEVSQGPNWQPIDMTIVMVHGLGGCHQAGYLQRLTWRFLQQGDKRIVRVNLRGCGSGEGLARGLYHGGRSDDIKQVLQQLKQDAPDSPLALVGFSLGGNISLKLAGELGAEAVGLLDRLMVLSPPVELQRSAEMIKQPGNKVFRRYFMGLMQQTVQKRHALYPDLPPPPDFDWKKIGFYEFDDGYTAPYAGFQGADDYYFNCSAIRVVDQIAIPTNIVFSQDDPFVDCHALFDLGLPDAVELTPTQHGGHMGFLAMPSKNQHWRWMDQQIDRWVHRCF